MVVPAASGVRVPWKHLSSTHDGIPHSLLARAAQTATAPSPMLLAQISSLEHQRFGGADRPVVAALGALGPLSRPKPKTARRPSNARRCDGHARARFQPRASCAERKPPLSGTAALRLKRVFQIDVETCPNCGGTVQIIASTRDGFAQGLLAFGKPPHRSRLHARRLRSGASCLRQTAPSLSPALKTRRSLSGY